MAPVIVIDVPQQLIVGTRQDFKERVRLHMLSGSDVIIDLSTTTYLDSSGCGVLVNLAHTARDYRRRLIVCGANEDLRTLFELTKLDVELNLVRDVEAARQQMMGAA
jgi:anti-sigma B factor antagonist